MNRRPSKVRSYRAVVLQLAIVLIVSGGIVVATPQAANAAEDFAALRAGWVESQTGGDSFDPADPRLAPKVDAISNLAQSHWDSMNTGSGRTSLWDDLAPIPADSAAITGTYRRLHEMAMAYRTHGSVQENDPALLSAIVGGLDWLNSHVFNDASTSTGNWWDWEIGSPALLSKITLLLHDELSPAQIIAYMDAVDRFCSDPLVLHENTPGGPTVNTGYNLASKAEVVALRAIVLGDTVRLARARDSLSSLFDYVTDGDGFYGDGSFIFHTAFPYTGGYGLSMLVKLLSVVDVLSASADHQLTDPDFVHVYDWVYDAFDPLMYRGGMMSMVMGREISRSSRQESNVGQSLIVAVIDLARTAAAMGDSAHAATFRSMAKRWIQGGSSLDFFSNPDVSIPSTIEADAIVADVSIVADQGPTGFFSYSSMDRALVRRDQYAFGVSMHSTRTQNFEISGGENLAGWHTADGMTYLYNGDVDQFNGDFWPTVDPMRLPGTTVTKGSTGTTRRFSDKTWVGGAGLGEYGISGMWMRPYGQQLSGKKSWFMFGDEIVALGADIDSTSASPVETIIENRKLSPTGNDAFVVDGAARSTGAWSQVLTSPSWAHLAGATQDSDIGYYFPDPASVHGLRETRTGTWRAINDRDTSPSDPRSNTFLSLWFDHGAAPSDADYSYVLLPGKSSEETEAYASDPGILVVANSAEAQAVRDVEEGLLGINFWSDGLSSVEDVTVNRRASVVTRETTDAFEIAVSDPTQLNRGEIEVEIDRPATGLISADPGVTVVQYHPTMKLRVDVSEAQGQSLTAKLTLTGPSANNPSEVPPPIPRGVEVVDNTDPGFASETTWAVSSASAGTQGADYAHDGSASADPLKWAMWTPHVDKSDPYAVYMRWTSHSNRADAVPVEITHAGGVATTTVNQTARGGDWVYLGTYDLTAGTSNSVRITAGDSGYTVADAVKFERVHRSQAETVPSTGSGATLSVQTDSAASGGKWQKLNADGVGDYVEYTVDVPNPGRYDVRLRAKANNQRGKFRLELPDEGVYVGGTFDQYSATEQYVQFDLGDHTFGAAGEQTFRLTVSGRNTASSGYSLGNDVIELIPRARYELERVAATAAGAALSIQTDAQTSAGGWSKLNADGVGDRVDFAIDVPAAGTYAIQLRAKTNDQRGVFRLYLPGAGAYIGGSFDQFSLSEGYQTYDIGSHHFSGAGIHTFRLEVTGRHADSSGYSLGNDYIELIPLD